MLTVLAITDEPLIAVGLRSLLDDAEEFKFLGSCHDLAELHRAAAADADILLCAVRGEPDVSLRELRAASPRSVLVILRNEFSPEYARQALDSGVRGLISTTAGADALKDCLRRTARGELWLENALSMMLLDTHPIHLSKRQFELIHLLAQGLKNKEIAAVLGISEGTVKAYLTTLYEKVGAKDRFELALFGLRRLKDLNGREAVDRSITRPARAFVHRAGKTGAA